MDIVNRFSFCFTYRNVLYFRKAKVIQLIIFTAQQTSVGSLNIQLSKLMAYINKNWNDIDD